ncbi:Serine/threonine-protein kinase AFC2 [Acorus calamus]|uniref:Serine/threonine-protein kinase AFC2 n=1 Tax=Acorus calamus TaxID=4465 RepID=A0AAV9E6J3_ACOCL|nr:Serine/threonine-protein kinase AFC2 [Acorus calamus]
MAESVEEILEFLRRNKFTRAEAALRGELGGRSDLKGPVPKPDEGLKVAESGRGPVKQGGDASRELIVKEIECGTVNASVATDLYPWNFGGADDFMEILISEQPRHLRKAKSEAPDNPWSSSKNGDEQPLPPVASSSCSGPWKEFSVVKTVFPAIDDGKKDRKKRTEAVECLEVDLPSIVVENNKQELPRLAPVKLKSEDKQLSVHWEEKNERHGLRISGTEDNAFSIGAFLDVPIGQEINSTGVGKRAAGSSWLSVSQGIAEDNSDLVSGFATVGDGLSESVDYANEYWDSDEYDDDDDVGYMRQPIEDETWFLAHEIDYPSDNEKGAGHSSVPDQQERVPAKDEDDDQSFAEGDSYFSGEQYFQGKNLELAAPEDPIGLPMAEMYARGNANDLIADYDGQLIHPEELHLMRSDSVWQGFVPQNNELTILGNGRVPNDHERPRPDDLCVDDDQHGSVRSIGVGINSDAADIGSEVRESLLGGSSEGDLEYFHDHDIGISGFRHSQHDTGKNNLDRLKREKARKLKPGSDQFILGSEKVGGAPSTSYADSGFSFPPMRADDLLQAKSHKSLWSSKGNMVSGDDTDDFVNGLIGTDDKLASWRQKSSDSSPAKSSREENTENAVRSSTASSNCGYADGEYIKKDQDDNVSEAREDPRTALEDEEAAAVQEQIRQIRAQEDEFETFNLKIVHRKNRTGFEEDKNFHVVLNSVIAGRYHVTEYLGSAAFSKAIQAHDLHTGMDVCVKIIKNNKDFFDQSLDEIKLLKYVNKHDPSDKYHLLRLYDYFYYREHLLIVCELLKANLYEFHKFNRESGGEVYFTMPRLQSITIQCLEALQFLHGLGLIHCDLKPENILVKSYSRCEVKVIDLGSSCFETDHLCSYVQSRSYRAPEVILGLAYDKKIDIWSLGCILAELCTGNVLFQNDSPATLLARVIGIIGPIEQGMLAKGRDTYKYFTKNHSLYERNQETNRLEYLIPKKTSLRHRLPMADQGFIDFVAHILEINPKKRPTASEALKHPWLSFPYEPISS